MCIGLGSSRPDKPRTPGQGGKPSGWLGGILVRFMNRWHSRLTDWGLTHVTIAPTDVVLDVGCGGGRTVGKLAALAREGRVYGVDHSEASVAASRRTNRRLIQQGRVEIRQGSVSSLPYAEGTFDLVTAVETHFFWPDLPHDMGEVWRVLKPGGRIAIIAEFYNGGKHAKYADRLARLSGMVALTVAEHRELLSQAGFADVEVAEVARRGWLCATGRKPA